MQPLGGKPMQFPGKVDHHPRPKKYWSNWWECEGTAQNKKAARRKAKKDIERRLGVICWGVKS